jgi:hypothetical protein
MSDHSPLLVISGDSNNTPPKNRELKFNIARFKQEDFLETIAKILDKPIKSSDPIDILKIKLKRFKKNFKGWGSNLYGHIKKRKNALREELVCVEAEQEISSFFPEVFIRKTKILAELHNILDNEELLWLQRAHERLLLQDDHNIANFHRIANVRKRKKSIHTLKDDDVIIEGNTNLLDHATSFYKNMFGPAPGNLVKMSDDL